MHACSISATFTVTKERGDAKKDARVIFEGVQTNSLTRYFDCDLL